MRSRFQSLLSQSIFNCCKLVYKLFFGFLKLHIVQNYLFLVVSFVVFSSLNEDYFNSIRLIQSAENWPKSCNPQEQPLLKGLHHYLGKIASKTIVRVMPRCFVHSFSALVFMNLVFHVPC